MAHDKSGLFDIVGGECRLAGFGLAEPTGPMTTEAIKECLYETESGRFPKLQIPTIEDLFKGKRPQLPWLEPKDFKKATRVKQRASKVS